MTTCRVSSASHWLPVLAGWCLLHATAQRFGLPEWALLPRDCVAVVQLEMTP